jgi:hypothetical protein
LKNDKHSVFIIIFFVLITSCSVFRDKNNSKEPSESDIKKELFKQQRKQHKRYIKASKKAKKDFWNKQTPEMKRRIKETYKRDREMMRNMKRKQKMYGEL